jgi:protein-tyrosine phosphatase
LYIFTAALNTAMSKIKVLFVCLGNICRSPLAEAVFKHKVIARGLDKFIVADSCGTANYHVGDTPDPRTIANAKKNGVNINHCGRQLKSTDLENFDFILAMDASNYDNIMRLQNATQHTSKIMMMREYDPLGRGDVPDPYYGGERHFQDVFDILDRTMDAFVKHLEEVHVSSFRA